MKMVTEMPIRWRLVFVLVCVSVHQLTPAAPLHAHAFFPDLFLPFYPSPIPISILLHAV